MILGGWGIERPLLIRSDGIICSNQDSEEDDEINMMPKYPQVRLRFFLENKIIISSCHKFFKPKYFLTLGALR